MDNKSAERPPAGIRSQNALDAGLPKVKQNISIIGSGPDQANEPRSNQFALPNLNNLKSGGEAGFQKEISPFSKNKFNPDIHLQSKVQLQTNNFITPDLRRKNKESEDFPSDNYGLMHGNGEHLQMENMRKLKSNEVSNIIF